jgi:hypothetical protein
MDLNLHKSTVTRMYYQLGYDVRTISLKTGIPVNSVKMLIQKKDLKTTFLHGKRIPYYDTEEQYASAYAFDELKKVKYSDVAYEIFKSLEAVAGIAGNGKCMVSGGFNTTNLSNSTKVNEQ